jgi:hypothetical protein
MVKFEYRENGSPKLTNGARESEPVLSGNCYLEDWGDNLPWFEITMDMKKLRLE